MDNSASPPLPLPLPLHQSHAYKLWGILNRTYSFLHLLALGPIFYYRVSFFFNNNNPKYLLPWALFFGAELVLSLMWVLKEPINWFPMTRTVFPDRLPGDSGLPKIDVFICTADPEKEPTFNVMNTVISAMALNYPCDKLSVYLSDDAGASVTLEGMKEAWGFATWWLPFCRKYGVNTICPRAYFEGNEEGGQSMEFIDDRNRTKEKYEAFKQRVVRKWKGELENDAKRSPRDHPVVVQMISDYSVEDDAEILNPEHVDMPLLMYVAREKSPHHPHNFKAGALNALMRVSSITSNAPYILVLDCDMYCNDSISARQAMCFYVDPSTPSSLAWVQFPQKFHNINEADVYDSQMRTIWAVYFLGLDGLQGSLICGTNFYIKREALYGFDIDTGTVVKEMRDCFGCSNEFLKSLSQNDKSNTINERCQSPALLKEALFLASCTYEKGTKWGDEVGFRYGSLTEDLKTCFELQSKGWRSVFLNPERAQFLGTGTNNLDELLVQGIRWQAGMLNIGLSKHSPLIYRPSKSQFLQNMVYSWISFFPLEFFPVLCFSILPPLCFFYGLPLLPKVSDPFFIAFAYVFVSSRLKGVYEHIMSGGSVRTWVNEQRVWIIKSATSAMYATFDCVMGKMGIKEASFTPTNKAGGQEKTKYYQMGMYDFRTSNMFLVPIVSMAILNLVSLVSGIVRVMILGLSWQTFLAQLIFSIYVAFMSFPVVEGVFFRKDDGRVSLSASVVSFIVSFSVLASGYFFFH